MPHLRSAVINSSSKASHAAAVHFNWPGLLIFVVRCGSPEYTHRVYVLKGIMASRPGVLCEALTQPHMIHVVACMGPDGLCSLVVCSLEMKGDKKKFEAHVVFGAFVQDGRFCLPGRRQSRGPLATHRTHNERLLSWLAWLGTRQANGDVWLLEFTNQRQYAADADKPAKLPDRAKRTTREHRCPSPPSPSPVSAPGLTGVVPSLITWALRSRANSDPRAMADLGEKNRPSFSTFRRRQDEGKPLVFVSQEPQSTGKTAQIAEAHFTFQTSSRAREPRTSAGLQSPNTAPPCSRRPVLPRSRRARPGS